MKKILNFFIASVNITSLICAADFERPVTPISDISRELVSTQEVYWKDLPLETQGIVDPNLKVVITYYRYNQNLTWDSVTQNAENYHQKYLEYLQAVGAHNAVAREKKLEIIFPKFAQNYKDLVEFKTVIIQDPSNNIVKARIAYEWSCGQDIFGFVKKMKQQEQERKELNLALCNKWNGAVQK